MNNVPAELIVQKTFLETSINILSNMDTELQRWEEVSLLNDLRRQLRPFLGRVNDAQSSLITEIEDLECSGETELTGKVKHSLLRRTRRQILDREIEVPPDFFNNQTIMMQKEITDRNTETGMWLAHYSWKTESVGYQSTDSWRPYKPSRNVHASFLCGREDGQDWVVRIPGTIQEIGKALGWITPAAVKKAQKEGKPVYRQGDFYFISLRLYDDDMNALWGSRHRKEFDINDGSTKIVHPQHPDLKLPKLPEHYGWRAIQQKQLGNDNERVGAD